MSNIADRVRTAQDKDGMLRRALERIIQLYTDKSHFVYELLQNAEDAEAKSIRFIQHADCLEVLHDGKPFTSANLQGLCDIGKSDKVDNLNQIGEFGVGFKSVFGICDTVRLFSDPSHFDGKVEGDAVAFAVEIKDFTRPEDIPEEPMPRTYTTRFVFPFAVGHTFSGFKTIPSLADTLARKLQNLGITTLLFMKHLELIEYEIETDEEPITGEYLLEKRSINDHCYLVSALGISEKEKADPDAAEMISYLKFSRRLEKYPLRTVDIAFPVKEEKDGYQCIKAPNPYVSVYFPTETESKLDFIVQGPYRTTPNRSSIPSEDADNIYLAKETAILLRESLLELQAAGKLNMSFVKTLPIVEDRFDTFGLFFPLYETVRDLFRSAAIIPSKDGKYVYAKYARITRQERLATVFSDELLSQLINDGGAYCWLPTYLTETNREYKHVLDYMTGELNIPVIRPEDLRTYFSSNPKFLPERSLDWLVDLYSIFENIPGAFSKSRYETNMTTANIVKTASGAFVAPFRREGKSYIPNVFLPSPKIRSADINFVDAELYERCRHFFDDILQLQKPNEYEFIIKDNHGTGSKKSRQSYAADRGRAARRGHSTKEAEGSGIRSCIYRQGRAGRQLRATSRTLHQSDKKQPRMGIRESVSRPRYHRNQSRKTPGIHEDDRGLPRGQNREDHGKIRIPLRPQHRGRPELHSGAARHECVRAIRVGEHRHPDPWRRGTADNPCSYGRTGIAHHEQQHQVGLPEKI